MVIIFRGKYADLFISIISGAVHSVVIAHGLVKEKFNKHSDVNSFRN